SSGPSFDAGTTPRTGLRRPFPMVTAPVTAAVTPHGWLSAHRGTSRRRGHTARVTTPDEATRMIREPRQGGRRELPAHRRARTYRRHADRSARVHGWHDRLVLLPPLRLPQCVRLAARREQGR